MAEIAQDLFAHAERYPARPGFKERTTSRAAAAAIAPRAPTLRDRVLAEIAKADMGLTADEVAARIGATEFAVRPRLSELRKAGKIVPRPVFPGSSVFTRRFNESGQLAIVWVVKP